MASDLDALSREVAAAGDEWQQVGVQAMTNVDCPVLLVYRRHGGWFGIWGDDRDVEAVLPLDIVGPNLRDPVTVNALLGNGVVYQAVDDLWNANCGQDSTTWAAASDRTTAICRAWIAARGKKG